MARRGYPAEFRRRVVDLVEGGRKVSEVATELGVSEHTIYVWRRQARIEAGPSRHPSRASSWPRRGAFASSRMNSPQSPLRSTADLARPLTGRHLPKPWIITYVHTNTKPLRRPLESGQFTSWTFTQRASDSGLLPSMGSVGDCYDNAMIESF